MDSKDFPLRALCGIDRIGWKDTDELGPELQWTIDYFEQRRPWSRNGRPSRPLLSDEPPTPAPTLVIGQRQRHDWTGAEPLERLNNNYPAPLRLSCGIFPSVDHAYWALSLSDDPEREAIRQAPNVWMAQRIAAASTARTPDWHRVRTAVMASLMRLKFQQHPDIAAILLGTGDAKIQYLHYGSAHWGSGPEAGGNWTGRLLELIRSELHFAQAFPDVTDFLS
nr:NADAR family protein [Glycomyces sp. L485]